MSKRDRPEKLQATAFDGLAAALSPALIIGMIGSLVFFLVIAFYRGQYDARLMYILALYTTATVLVARIAIESDRARAIAFAIPLAIAAMLAMMRFVTISGELAALSWIVNIALLGLVYYLADRITFDCTLLEEDRESLQGGLLQTIGSSVASAAQPKPQGASPGSASNSIGVKQPIGAAPLKKAKHNPGVWVLYFALIAFPLFGVGQLVIPDERQRSIAFWCLVAYLACALALLMTTSLLGMRRYLRQRGAMMPPDITAKWLVAGGMITVVILIACMLMPLPGKQLSIAGIKLELTSPDNLQTSKFGWGNDGRNDGQAGKATEKSSEQAKGDGQQDKSSQANNDSSNAAQRDNDKSPSGDKSEGQNGDQNGQGKSNSTDQSQSQSQSKSSSDQGSSKQSNSQSNNSSSQQGKDQQSDSSKSQSQQKPGNPDQGGQSPKKPQGKDSQGKDSQGKDSQGSQENRNGKQPQTDPSQPKKSQADRPQQPDQQPAQQNRQVQKQSDSSSDANPASQPMRAGDSLSQTSRSLASSLLESFKSLGNLFKWLLIAVLAGIVLFYVATRFDELKQLIADLINFMNALMGRRARSAAAQPTEEAAVLNEPARRPFKAFQNPFALGMKGWQAPQVVLHTFSALEAWAAQRGRVRAVDQTAEEFARSLVAEEPELDRLPLQAASMLDRVMFAGWQPSRQEIVALEQLWERMTD